MTDKKKEKKHTHTHKKTSTVVIFTLPTYPQLSVQLLFSCVEDHIISSGSSDTKNKNIKK